jgi:hypothetical protein
MQYLPVIMMLLLTNLNPTENMMKIYSSYEVGEAEVAEAEVGEAGIEVTEVAEANIEVEQFEVELCTSQYNLDLKKTKQLLNLIPLLLLPLPLPLPLLLIPLPLLPLLLL